MQTVPPGRRDGGGAGGHRQPVPFATKRSIASSRLCERSPRTVSLAKTPRAPRMAVFRSSDMREAFVGFGGCENGQRVVAAWRPIQKHLATWAWCIMPECQRDIVMVWRSACIDTRR